MAKGYNPNNKNRDNRNNNNSNTEPLMVKSPYNFVPAPEADEVFTPEWADKVLHDMPLSKDALSGEISYTIEAKSPIFIRNGHSKKDHEVFEKWRDNKDKKDFSLTEDEQKALGRYLSFSNYEGKYFIPATSIKGMLRNVVEIVSNSKLTQINDHRHAVRQIMRTKDDVVDEGYELKEPKEKGNIKAGYLIKKGNDYYIYPCKSFSKIRYTDVDKILKTNFESQFGESNESNLSEEFDNRTAKYKYDLVGSIELEYEFERHPLDEDEKQPSWVSIFQPFPYARKKLEGTDQESFWGRIVFAGQASLYTVSTSRRGEYVFHGKKADVLAKDDLKIPLTEDQIETFKFINRDGESESLILKDWAYWKNKIHEGVPVFYRVGDKEKTIKDFGLTYMYKQPAKYSVKDLLPDYKNEKDLSVTIFGETNKDDSSKGRVFIGQAKIDQIPANKIIETKVVTLSTPKSSFFPNYLVNSVNLNGKLTTYNTYNTEGSKLRGYKKYPIKGNVIDHVGESAKLHSHFKPLPQGSIFKGVIRFHNLKPIEIGAVLSAITLLNGKERYHNIGYAKPLGYGMIKFEDVKLNNDAKLINQYCDLFEIEMRARFGKTWANHMKELMAMAVPADDTVSALLKYNDLKDFQQLKNKGFALKPYSEISNFKEVVIKDSLSERVKEKDEEINSEKIEKERKINNLKSKFQEAKNNRHYELALDILNDLEEFKTSEAFQNERKLIILAKEENDQKLIFQNLLANGSLQELQSFKAENPYHERISEINARINTFLPPEYPQRWKNLDAIALIREAFLEARKDILLQFKDEFIIDLGNAIKRLNNRDRKIWQDFNNKNTWNKVITNLGEAEAKNLFDELNNPTP